MSEVFNYDSSEDVYYNPYVPKNLSIFRRIEGYAVYQHSKTKSIYVDILGKKYASPKSFFIQVLDLNEAIELIKLIKTEVRS